MAASPTGEDVAPAASPAEGWERTGATAIPTFAELYDTYRADLLRYCQLRLDTDEDAEDALQEIFVSVYRALPAFTERGGGMRPWLFSIAHNEIVSRHRAQPSARAVPFDDAAPVSDPSSSPEQQALLADEFERALGLVRTLGDDQRQVVALRLAGLSGEEIAAAMGKRHATVRKLQERAIRKLTAMRLADASRGGKPA